MTTDRPSPVKGLRVKTNGSRGWCAAKGGRPNRAVDDAAMAHAGDVMAAGDAMVVARGRVRPRLLPIIRSSPPPSLRFPPNQFG